MAEPKLRDRAWLLGLIVLSDWAGMRTLTKAQVHALVFLANCLAPIYDDTGVETRVVKLRMGPFYPDAQWDLDRMVGQGLLHIEQVRLYRSNGRWWMDAHYSPSKRGREVFEQCRDLPLLNRSFKFLLELTSAFASLNRDTRDAAPLKDAIYATPGRRYRSALVFEDATTNYSTRTAHAFDDLVGPDLPLGPKERLNLYFGYLAEASKVAVEAGK